MNNKDTMAVDHGGVIFIHAGFPLRWRLSSAREAENVGGRRRRRVYG